LNAGSGQTFAAAYTDPSGNYEAASGTITVNVASIDVSVSEITVDGQPADRDGNNFSILAQCGENSVEISVTADPLATVTINGVVQNPYTVNLPNYGVNTITIVTTAQNGDSETYTLTVNKPIPADVAFYNRFAGVLTVPAQIAGVGAVYSVAWYRDGVLLDRDVTKGYIEMKETGAYYAIINGTIRTCTVVGTGRAASLTVYPNPTTGVVNIKSENAKIDRIQVFGINGRLLLETSENPFNISAMPAGIYVIKINGETINIIKQ
jgi:hypothetical protein